MYLKFRIGTCRGAVNEDGSSVRPSFRLSSGARGDPDISKWIEFGFYDYVWILHTPTNDMLDQTTQIGPSPVFTLSCVVPANVFCAVNKPIIHRLAKSIADTTHFFGRLATPEIETCSSIACVKVGPHITGEILVSACSYLLILLTALIVAVVVLNSTSVGFRSASHVNTM